MDKHKQYYVIERMTILVGSYVNAEDEEHAREIVNGRGAQEYDLFLKQEECEITQVIDTTEED